MNAKTIKKVMAEMGSRGGIARREMMTESERKEHARKAGIASGAARARKAKENAK